MKTITFTYKKPDNSISERTLLALVTPGGDTYAGIDVSSIEPDLAAEFVGRYKNLYEDYMAAVKELQEEFDLKHNYRQFKADRMSDITEI